MKYKILSLFYDNKKFAEFLLIETPKKRNYECHLVASHALPHLMWHTPWSVVPLIPPKYFSCVLLFCVIWHWNPFFLEALLSLSLHHRSNFQSLSSFIYLLHFSRYSTLSSSYFKKSPPSLDLITITSFWFLDHSVTFSYLFMTIPLTCILTTMTLL